MSNELLIQIIGWVGTCLVVAAYWLISIKKIDSQSRVYLGMNLLGAISMGINVGYQRAWPALGLQIIWGGIALVSLI
jgi:hypothetical protein